MAFSLVVVVSGGFCVTKLTEEDVFDSDRAPSDGGCWVLLQWFYEVSHAILKRLIHIQNEFVKVHILHSTAGFVLAGSCLMLGACFTTLKVTLPRYRHLNPCILCGHRV